MPVRLDLDCKNPFAKERAELSIGRSTPGLTLGLINNMGDAAARGAERQLTAVLEAASAGIDIRLCLYTLDSAADMKKGGRYQSIEHLYEAELDGLVVTGREPLTANLGDEAYWQDFTSVLDWAREHTLSTVWSCLAAHAAVLYMDGIGRHRSFEKHCGIFSCTHASTHSLMNGLPPVIDVPHSRWNGIDASALAGCGYTLLSCTHEGEVDSFIKEDGSLFVFYQGHPEYETDTLLREYRRDVARYLSGQSARLPSVPRAYFAKGTEYALAALEGKARSNRGVNLLEELDSLLGRTLIQNTWQETAALRYRNWLKEVCARKASLNMRVGSTVALRY